MPEVLEHAHYRFSHGWQRYGDVQGRLERLEEAEFPGLRRLTFIGDGEACLRQACGIFHYMEPFIARSADLDVVSIINVATYHFSVPFLGWILAEHMEPFVGERASVKEDGMSCFRDLFPCFCLTK